jgi:hypothetical protein
MMTDLYPCPCGCGERFGTGNGAIMHAINREDADHQRVSSRLDAYEELVNRLVTECGFIQPF